MKLLFILIWFCLTCVQAWAGSNPYVLGGGVPAAADGPNVYYYPSGKSESSFTGSQTGLSGYKAGGVITTDQSGTATKIRVKIDANSTSGNVKCCVYDNSNNLLGGGTFTLDNDDGPKWYECNLSSSFSAPAATYKVLAHLESDTPGLAKDTSGGIYEATVYSSDCSATLSSSAGDVYGVALYVD